MSSNFGRSSVSLVIGCSALLSLAACSGRFHNVVSVEDAPDFTSLGIDERGAFVIRGDVGEYMLLWCTSGDFWLRQ